DCMWPSGASSSLDMNPRRTPSGHAPDANRSITCAPDVAEVEARLRRTYGSPRHPNQDDPLDELVFIVLSAPTEEYSYLRTFDALRAAYPGWNGLACADEDAIAATIRAGGLYRKKARQLKRAIGRISRETGTPSLAFLRSWTDDKVLGYLVSLAGL